LINYHFYLGDFLRKIVVMELPNSNNLRKNASFAGGRISSLNRWLDTGLGKIPPQAVDLEEAVLGALLIEKDALTSVVDILHPDSFYKEAHVRIYAAVLTLFANSEPIDLLTVSNQLRSTGELDMVGGALYLTQLTERINSAANIEYHARIVAESAMKRSLISITAEVQKLAYEDTTDVFHLLDKIEQELFKITENNIRKNYMDMSQIMKQALDELEAKKHMKEGLTGVASGFSGLDRVTSGWQKTELTIIAARPAMGKCLGKGTKVLMFDGRLKKVEDIQVGEQLMGDDSKPRNVLSIARGRENMYWVRQQNGISYRVNESHILSLKTQTNETQNIEVRDYLKLTDKESLKGYKVGVDFVEKPLAVHPYLVGYALGNSQKIEEVLSLKASSMNGSSFDIATDSNYSAFAASSIPQSYIANSSQNRLELLAGLVDSAGYYSIQGNCYTLHIAQLELAQQVKFLGDTLGFRTSLSAQNQNYSVTFSGNIDSIPVKAEANEVILTNDTPNWQLSDISVTFDKEDDFYGFTIDGNHLFLLEDLTVTHNTAFILSACRNAAVDWGQAVAVFSLEMSSVQLVNRLISAEAEIESEKLRKGNLQPHEWQQLHHKIGRLMSAPIFIDDTPALSILELRAKCRRLKAQHDIQLIVIDYLQLMSGDSGSGKTGNREQEIASISRALKNLAKELDVPVIALSQLSRAVETRGGDKRPQLSDLRESGSIEQDADMVMFLYRPEYYGITADEAGNSVAGLGEVIIAKNRAGSLDTIQLKFIGKYTKYCDLDSSDFPAGDGLSSFSTLEVTGLASFDNPIETPAITMPSKANQKPNDGNNLNAGYGGSTSGLGFSNDVPF
jgi:replicative DNA helicase